ncbi:MAG: hypothetical protein N2517_08680 [Ignavibacteria bacterium]|nr:hypothetical protein [Ignavibacteria bacterium]
MKSFKFFLIFILLFSCNSPKYPFCLNEKTREIKITWGTKYTTTNKQEIFTLSADGKIYYANTYGKKKHIVKLNETQFCNLLDRINEAILKTQVINEVGDTLNFITYENPNIGVFSNAVWNPRFATKNSRHFRELYDTLKTLTFK